MIGAAAASQNASASRRSASGRPGTLRRDPVTLVIVAATLLALGLRLWQLLRPGYLLGLTEYDDGPYFGSAVRLVQGVLPYRGFILVQPPGITLLMVPAALAGKLAGTAWGLAAGRILTTLACTAGVPLAGLLVRHRGVVATTVACGLLAVYPDSVASAHTVLVEPWLTAFCLAGAVAVFDGDRLVSGRRLAWGGAAFGFAGAVESWAIVPVLVVLALCFSRPRARLRRAGVFTAGAAVGFALPVLPFAAAAPVRFYQSLVVAQVGPRAGVTRVPVFARLAEMAGLSYAHRPAHGTVELAAAALVLLTVGGLAAAALAARRAPTALEWFAVAATALVVVMFLWPSQFHYHFCAFLAPFLGLAIALPVGVLAGQPGRPWPRWAAAGLTAALIAVFAVIGFRAESMLRPDVTPATIAAAGRLIPPGSCVVTDEVSLTLLADRFTSAAPGCSQVVDGLGTDLALSGGLKPATGAGRVPAVAAVWRQAFDRAQFIWLSRLSRRRIAWSPALRAYFASHFTRVLTDRRGDALYRRGGAPDGPAAPLAPGASGSPRAQRNAQISAAAGSRRSSRPG